MKTVEHKLLSEEDKSILIPEGSIRTSAALISTLKYLRANKKLMESGCLYDMYFSHPMIYHAAKKFMKTKSKSKEALQVNDEMYLVNGAIEIIKEDISEIEKAEVLSPIIDYLVKIDKKYEYLRNKK